MDDSRICPACLGRDSTPLGSVSGFDIRSCARCRTLFTARLPAQGESTDYADFYAEGRDVAVPDFVLDQLRALARSLTGYRTAGRWLDIGCGSGTLLRAAGAE